jgi:hypothetical protein
MRFESGRGPFLQTFSSLVAEPFHRMLDAGGEGGGSFPSQRFAGFVHPKKLAVQRLDG